MHTSPRLITYSQRFHREKATSSPPPFLPRRFSLFPTLAFSPSLLRRLFFIHSCPRRLLLKSDEIINSSVSCELSCTPRDMIESTRDIHQVRGLTIRPAMNILDHDTSYIYSRIYIYIYISCIKKCCSVFNFLWKGKFFSKFWNKGRTGFLLSITRIFIFIIFLLLL